jgi:hypothetical protein
MAFGMTGDAHASDAARLDQARGGNIKARLEGSLRRGNVAGDQQNPRDISLAACARQKIVERLARGHFARGDMGDRIETGAAQRGCGFEIVTIVVAGQERDGDIGTARNIVRQFLQLVAARGNLDGGRR